MPARKTGDAFRGEKQPERTSSVNNNGQARARKALQQQLQAWQQSGVTHVAKRSAAVSTATIGEKPAATSGQSDIRQAPAAPVETPSAATRPEQREAALEIIRCEVAACTRCPQLARTRTQTVFGVGNPHTRLVFVGEAPGADEDAQGVPFVGRAGQLLTKIIEACTLKREDVYILNVLKCRPPNNRTPLPDEVANCRGYLDRQLEILQPEFICCLGTVAAQTVLDTTTTIGRLRGRFHEYRGIPVICTYHPSYLLRNPAAKRDVWEDMKTLMRRMGVEL